MLRIGRNTIAVTSIGLAPALAEAVPAGNPDGSLRIEVVTAYNFIVDSNVESPSTYAPPAAYIEARIWNDVSWLCMKIPTLGYCAICLVDARYKH